MGVAYVDASVVVAIALGEPTAAAARRRLGEFTVLASSPLLEAELRAVLRRSSVAFDHELVDRIEWVLPPGSLSTEIARVLDVGYVRGADCYHLASALFRAATPSALTFLTLDTRQRAVAKALGFKT